jgi:hypothetical protein
VTKYVQKPAGWWQDSKGRVGCERGLDIARWLVSRKHRGCSVFGKGF